MTEPGSGRLEQRKNGAATTGASPPPPESTPSYLWYEFCYSATYLGALLGFGARFAGGNNVPATGPALLLANHQSFLDPWIVGLATRRHLTFLARKTLFRNPLFARMIRSLRAIPVDQEGVAKEGLKAVIERLLAGEAVVVFPEGERTWRGPMQPFKPGVQLLIKRVQAPIVPVGIAGAFEAWPRTQKVPRLSPLFWPKGPNRVAVSIGRPLEWKRFAELPRDRLLGELFNEVKKQADAAERMRR